MMQAMMAMRSKLGGVQYEGRAGQNLVVVRFRKTEDFSTELTEITIDERLLREQPQRVPALVKEAVNDGLKKELEEMAKIMPKDVMSTFK